MFDALKSRVKPKAQLEDLPFDFVIKRSQRKTAAIHVKEQTVEVRIPHGVADSWAQQFVYEKRHWIENKLKAMASRAQQVPTLDWQTPLLWMGQYKQLAYYSSPKKRVVLSGQELQIHSPKKPDTDQLKNQLADFFKRQAKVYLTTRTLEIAEKIGLKHKLNGIAFRRTKSKWGHCTSNGDIQYNWLIMGAPEAIIDYLIYHELTHLVYHNHSAAYWQKLGEFFPDYERGKKWLKGNGHRLSWY